jgi:hypothetical protein
MNKILPAKFRQNEKKKNKNGIFCHNILVLKKRKKKAKFEKFLLQKTFAIFGLCF